MNMHESIIWEVIAMKTFLFVLEAILGLIVVGSILMQKSKADALSGLIQGSKNETFFAKNKFILNDFKVQLISIGYI